MIGSEFYKGQGLGNQLWAYAVVRSIAASRNLDFGFLGTDKFKAPWMSLDFGHGRSRGTTRIPIARIPEGFTAYLREKMVRHESGADISPMDPLVLKAKDGTFLDGTFQSEKYFHDIAEVKSWFRLEAERRDVCVLNIRGGEFKGTRELFLGRDYFAAAMEAMTSLVGVDQFEIVTDDPWLAKEWFPGIAVYSSGGVKRFHGGLYLHPAHELVRRDFQRIQTARYVICSNSSFSWWGAYTNQHAEVVIAPKYWARYNTSDGYWSNGDALTSGWLWLDRRGGLFNYETCLAELQ